MSKPSPYDFELSEFEYPGREFAIKENELSAAQKELIDRMESGPRRHVPINQRIWMHNIAFAEVAEKFGAYVSAKAPMTARQKEICVLLVASHWGSEFEWHWHEDMAHRQGITEEQTHRIHRNEPAIFEDTVEQTTHDVIRAILFDRNVPDELHGRAMEVLGLNSVLDLLGLAALYGMIAHTISFVRLQIPEGAK